MFRGVHDIGIGVSDMDKALKCYRYDLGFTNILFDYTGKLPGLEKIVGHNDTEARVVMLKNPNSGMLGVGMIRLVQILSPQKPSPLPAGIGWGEIGVAEISLEACKIDEVMNDLVDKKGYVMAMDIASPPVDDSGDASLMSYILDPDGGKVEFIEMPGLGDEKQIYGAFHVAVGVSNLDESVKFYKKLGLTDEIWVVEGVIDAMNPWHGKPQEMRINMLSDSLGAAVELVQHIPETKDCRGNWGHVGAMDFAIEVTNLEKTMEEMKKDGIVFHSEPQTIQVPSGEWKYVYFSDLDGNYVSLMEQRF